MSPEILDPGSDPDLYNITTHATGPVGKLPLTDSMLREWPSGDLFGWSQNAGMGWTADRMGGPQMLILSTQGGMRAPDGTPIALGLHTGHWEVGLLVQAAAQEIKRLGGIPFSLYTSDPCDGRTQGTTGMFDSLPYRNDAAMVLRRLARSLPTRKGVIGIATCDKGLPAMMLAIAGLKELPGILIPGGVTLPPTVGEDAGKVQTISARYVHKELSLEDAAALGCAACATPGGGCQFLGTAASSQVIAEALGLTLPHAALSPSGQPIWLDCALRSARAAHHLVESGTTTADILTDRSVRNAMMVHAACAGSTNLLLHLPAIAFAAGLERPTVDDWFATNSTAPRFVDCLPNGPVNHTTVQFFLAGGVPEVMLKLRDLNLLHLDVPTVSGQSLSDNLSWWESSERRKRVREVLYERDQVDPDNVIMNPATARQRGLTGTVCFPKGNLAPEGSVVKSTSIAAKHIDGDGIFRQTGSARVFTAERDAMAALKGLQGEQIRPGDVIVLAGRGPSGSGMEECAQIAIAMAHLSWGSQVALVSDARFSGVTSGACIGHVGPEALAGGPIGKVRDGDVIQIVIDCHNLQGSIDLVGAGNQQFSPAKGAKVLAGRDRHPAIRPDPSLPDDTRLWAALQQASGGAWNGCVYDVDRIAAVLDAGIKALNNDGYKHPEK